MILEILIWLFLLESISFVSLPFTYFLFNKLKDKGYAFSKVIGILILCFVSWYLSFLIKYEISIILSLTLLITLNLFLIKKIKLGFDKKIVKINEAVFVISFVAFSVIRSFTPAVEGLEKLFDISIINGIMQSEKMPPNDPWFAGHKINYYYFGHFIVSTLTKISFLPSYVTFNLSLAMIYSILAVEIFSILFNITGRIKFGFIGIFLFLFISNLLGFLQILTFIKPSLVEFFSNNFNIKYAMTCCHNPEQNFFQFLLSFPVWPSTRVIPDTINEFPYANFLFGEVHSHILSLPVQLLFISTLFCIYTSKNHKKFLILFSSLLLSILYITNSWDLLNYFLLFSTIIIVLFFEKKINLKNLLYYLFLFLFMFAIFSLPQILTIKKKVNFGITNEKSNIFQELILFPVFIYSIIYYSIGLMKRNEIYKILFIVLFSIVLYFLTNIQLIILLLPLISLILLNITHKKNKFIDILILFGCFIMLFTEIFYIDSRYNTVFKFYYHIWIFWSIAAATIIQKLSKEKTFTLILLILIFLSLPMTIFATIDRINQGLNEGMSLNGIKYMEKYHKDDYNLLTWARKNINKNEIILEASGDAFTYSSIFSSYTGFQTLVGWSNHVGIHHEIWPEERISDIKTIYETSNETLAKELIEKYNISYVFVGSVELAKYPNISLEKFGKPIFVSGNEFIFKVK
jgi:YYY domain-containing protein